MKPVLTVADAGRWNRFRVVLAGATSLIALAAVQPARAQAADQPPPSSQQADTAAAAAVANGDAEEIIVTGIIGSLRRNLDIKRAAPGVVDVISSEDIGKFPDSNVASALQRLPGVSIQRSGSRGDATGVSIRGFGGGFIDTLYDGRHISTATGDRGVDFTTVGSDFVGRLSVYKTPDVALSTSAIGGSSRVSARRRVSSASKAGSTSPSTGACRTPPMPTCCGARLRRPISTKRAALQKPSTPSSRRSYWPIIARPASTGRRSSTTPRSPASNASWGPWATSISSLRWPGSMP